MLAETQLDNGHQPATKLEFALLSSEVPPTRDALVERIAEMETKLLMAFHTFTVLNRLATLESRIALVEKHLNLPPGRLTGA
jgi:hypothetical protein